MHFLWSDGTWLCVVSMPHGPLFMFMGDNESVHACVGLRPEMFLSLNIFKHNYCVWSVSVILKLRLCAKEKVYLHNCRKQTQNTYFVIQLKLLIQDMTEDVTLSLDVFMHSSSFQTRTSALTLFFFGVHISLFLLAMALHHILHNWALTQKAVVVWYICFRWAHAARLKNKSHGMPNSTLH